MLARLPTENFPDPGDPNRPKYAVPPLAPLTSRAAGDAAIALVDAWATVADVLTFYQERIANEGYLRTATERRSVLELAREIGYELNPGVAANALLAFTVEDAEGAPRRATVDAGVKVLSIPGQNEHPQTFETVEAIEARAEWNALHPRLTAPQMVEMGTRELFLRGMATQLQPGDAILLVGAERIAYPGSERWDFRIVQTVEVVPPRPDLAREGYTRVTWEHGLGQPAGPTVAPAADPHVFAFRQRAALFGYNAPDFRAMPDEIKAAYDPDAARRIDAGQRPDRRRTQWPDFEIQQANQNVVDLDAVYPKVLAGSWVVLTRPGYAELYRVTRVESAARTDFTLSAKVSRLTFDAGEHLSWFGLRETVVFAQSEPLELAEPPVAAPVDGSQVVLDRVVPDLPPGRTLVFAGRPPGASESEPAVGEAATLRSAADDGRRTTITLAAPLQGSYDPATLTIYANVAHATHGETVRGEVLGSGSGAEANQRFALKKPPLTYVSAPTPNGAQSTLVVRVDDVQWQEAPSLFGLGPRDQKYTVRVEDDGRAAVIFGDGVMGARLPSGAQNVVATYRSGIGPQGNVAAGSLALLQTRPLGVRSVANPLPASGAAAPENLDQARPNAPLTVLTLDRIVSLRDFEDFARAFAGVGKAQATRLWNGHAHLAHVTVGGAGGGPVDPLATLPNLRAAIDAVRDPVQEVRVESYEPWSFGVAAKVLVDPRFVAADVLAAATAALQDAFSFARRSFGQAVSAAEVITVVQGTLIHGAPAVQAVDLDRLYFVRPPGVPGTTPLPVAPPGAPPPFLPAAIARWEGGGSQPAQLLLIDPAQIALTEMNLTS
jgi:predicted phage baseplate assembly protein